MTVTRQGGTSGRFRIGHVEVIVRSDLPELLDDFASLHAPRAAPAGPGRRTVIEMDVRRMPRWGRRRYEILGDGEAIHRDLRRDEVLPHLEWGISWRIVDRCDEFLQVHAASLARAGQGVVLAGPSGCGKSTLAAGLLARGWRYLSDEFALIDPDTLHLHAYPKAVCVKAGAFDVIRRLDLRLSGDRHYVKALKGTVGYLSPADFGPDAVADPCPIRHVLFPTYLESAQPRHRPMARGRTVFALAGQTLNRHAFGARAVSILGRAVREARCHALESGAIEPTCDLIESLVS